MYLKVNKVELFLFSLFFFVGVTHAQVQKVTAIYLFDVLFEAALGPEAVVNAKFCPGICVPSTVSNFCPKVFQEIQCATPNTKCCVRKSDTLFPGTKPEPSRITGDINLVEDDVIINPEYQSNNTVSSSLNDQAIAIIPDPSSIQQSVPSLPSVPSLTAIQTCPGYCMLNILRPFCEHPQIVIPTTSNCRTGTICCDNRPLLIAQANDKRPECPGVCISTSLRFTCYGNAEITDFYKCANYKSICCASKSHIQEILGINNHHHDVAAAVAAAPYRVTTSTPQPPIVVTHKVVKPTKISASEDACPGVCVVDHFAEYCEAQLTTDGLCENGMTCCVPPEKFRDHLPNGLRILKNTAAHDNLLKRKLFTTDSDQMIEIPTTPAEPIAPSTSQMGNKLKNTDFAEEKSTESVPIQTTSSEISEISTEKNLSAESL